MKHAVEDLVSTHELARRIRRNPWAWILGGAAAGVAAGGLLPRQVVAGARRGVATAIVPRLRTAVAGALAAVFATRGGEGGATLDANGAPRDEGGARRGEDAGA